MPQRQEQHQGRRGGARQQHQVEQRPLYPVHTCHACVCACARACVSECVHVYIHARRGKGRRGWVREVAGSAVGSLSSSHRVDELLTLAYEYGQQWAGADSRKTFRHFLTNIENGQKNEISEHNTSSLQNFRPSRSGSAKKASVSEAGTRPIRNPPGFGCRANAKISRDRILCLSKPAGFVFSNHKGHNYISTGLSGVSWGLPRTWVPANPVSGPWGRSSPAVARCGSE